MANEGTRRKDEVVSGLYTLVSTKVYDHASDRSEPVPDTILHLALAECRHFGTPVRRFNNSQNQSTAKIASRFFNFQDRDLNSFHTFFYLARVKSLPGFQIFAH